MGKEIEKADRLRDEAFDYYCDNQYENAIGLLTKATNIYAKFKEWDQVGSTLHTAGMVNYDMDKRYEAIELYRRAMESYYLANNEDEMARMSFYIASIYNELGIKARATKYLEHSYEIAKKLSDNFNVMIATSELAEQYLSEDINLAKAVRYAFKLLEATINSGDDVKIAFAECKLAVILDKKGYTEEALGIIRSALSRYVKCNVKYSNEYAICVFRYAEILTHIKEYDRAIKLLYEAMEIFGIVGKENNASVAKDSIASAYFENGDIDKAIGVIDYRPNSETDSTDADEEFYNCAKEAFRHGVNLFARYPYMDEADEFVAKAKSLQGGGYARETIANYKKAIALYKENDNMQHINVANYEYDLADIFVLIGDCKNASTYYKKAREVFNKYKMLSRVKDCDDALNTMSSDQFKVRCDLVADALSLLNNADTAYDEGDADKALEYYNELFVKYGYTEVLDKRYYAYVFFMKYKIHRAMKDSSYISDIETAVGYMPIDSKDREAVMLMADIHYYFAITIYDTKRDIGEAITHMSIAKKKYYSIGEEELGDDCVAHIKKFRNDL